MAQEVFGHTVKVATVCDKRLWDDFLLHQPGSSILGRFDWAGILERVFNVESLFLLSEKDNRVTGIFAGYITKDIFGDRLLYSTRAGFWPESLAAANAILEKIYEISKEKNIIKMEISSQASQSFAIHNSEKKHTVRLLLSKHEDGMWESLRDKTRNMIRKSIRNGVEVKSGVNYIDILYLQYRENMVRLGVRFQPKDFFQEVLGTFHSNTEILVAEWKGKIIASMMLHTGGEVACYPVQNADISYRHLAPVQLLNWEAMKISAHSDAKELDMGESVVGSPVFKSKVNFGGVPREIESIYSSNDVNALNNGVVRRFKGKGDFLLENKSPRFIRLMYGKAKSKLGRVL